MPPEFFLQDATEVARQLVGKILISTKHGQRTAGRIVETEAYLGERDEASHAWRGQTPRNSVMFGPAGHIYIYFTYGMHYCMNIVTGPQNVAEAVLIRALEPLWGIEVMEERRNTANILNLCSGPAKLVQALDVGKADNGIAIGPANQLWLEDDGTRLTTSAGPRIGISRAKEAPLRFWATGNPYVSKLGKR